MIYSLALLIIFIIFHSVKDFVYNNYCDHYNFSDHWLKIKQYFFFAKIFYNSLIENYFYIIFFNSELLQQSAQDQLQISPHNSGFLQYSCCYVVYYYMWLMERIRFLSVSVDAGDGQQSTAHSSAPHSTRYG